MDALETPMAKVLSDISLSLPGEKQQEHPRKRLGAVLLLAGLLACGSATTTPRRDDGRSQPISPVITGNQPQPGAAMRPLFPAPIKR